MSHRIQGLVARLETFSGVSSRFKAAHVTPLPQGFAFLPNTEELRADAGEDRVVPGEVFEALTVPLAELGVELSAVSPVAYIETDYWAGRGTQSAIAWSNRAVILEPVVYRSGEGNVLEVGAINRAFRLLGVERRAVDEFDSLSLGWYRRTESFVTGPDSAPRPPGG